MRLKCFDLIEQFSSLKRDIKNEDDVIAAAMLSLQSSGISGAILSLYNSGDKRIHTKEGFGKEWSRLLHPSTVNIDSNCILATVLQSGKPILWKDSKVQHKKSQKNDKPVQFILPLIVHDELIGIIQLFLINDTDIDKRNKQILIIFADLLAMAISRFKVIKEIELIYRELVATSKRLVADTIASMLIHQISHKMDNLNFRIRKLLSSTKLLALPELLNDISQIKNALDDFEDGLVKFFRFQKFDKDRNDMSLLNLNEAIKRNAEIFSRFLSSSKCNIQINKEAIHFLCYMRESDFREIFTVLLMNSIEAMATKITIKTFNDKDRKAGAYFIRHSFCLEFKDNGMGVMIDSSEELFSPTYSTKKNSADVGLGLFIARTLVRKYGGELEYIPLKARVKGALFRLVLPIEEK